MDTTTHDVAIIGGGPAGLSAALVLGRALRRVVVVDAGTPRNAPATHMQGFISRDGTPPTDLLREARAEVRRYDVDLIDDRVTGGAAGLTLRLASGRRLTSRHVLLAGGATDVLPDIPGVRERWGRDFLHCPYCHGWEVRDQRLGVLATGPGSVEHAHLLRQWSAHVMLFTHTTETSPEERAVLRSRGVAIADGEVQRLDVEADHLHAVILADGRSVPCDALFIRPALHAHPGALAPACGG
jgi:thioredoxin reductase